MTENEKLFVEVARELKKLLDHKMTIEGVGEVSLRGYFPESLWNKLHYKAGHLAGVAEAEAAYKATKPEPDALKARLDKLEARLAALELAPKGTQSHVMDLVGRVEKLEYEAESNIKSRLTTLEHLEQRSADEMRGVAREVFRAESGNGRDEDEMREMAQQAVDDLDLDSYVGTYLKDKGYVTESRMIEWVREYVSGRISCVEDEGAFQNNVELALVNILAESYKAPEDYAAFHRKFHALLKHHLGKLAREVTP